MTVLERAEEACQVPQSIQARLLPPEAPFRDSTKDTKATAELVEKMNYPNRITHVYDLVNSRETENQFMGTTKEIYGFIWAKFKPGGVSRG